MEEVKRGGGRTEGRPMRHTSRLPAVASAKAGLVLRAETFQGVAHRVAGNLDRPLHGLSHLHDQEQRRGQRQRPDEQDGDDGGVVRGQQAERFGSGDPTPCGGYAGFDCWDSIVIITKAAGLIQGVPQPLPRIEHDVLDSGRNLTGLPLALYW